MKDYKTPRQHKVRPNRFKRRNSNAIATAFWALIVVVVVLIAWGIAGNEYSKGERTEKSGAVYSKPAAFRKASPTHQQMWALDHLTEVSKVAHAERMQP